jgi:hypothetical protein
MDWEMFNDGKAVGPCDEADVLTAIKRGGLRDGSMARPAGTDEWRRLRAHAPFAMALDERSEAPAEPVAATAPARHPGSLRPWFLGVGAALAFLFLAIVVRWMRPSSPTQAVAETVHVTASPPVPIQPPHRTPVQIILEARTASVAFGVARSSMNDEPNKISDGAFLFAIWGAQKGHWIDFAPKQDETSVGKVMKDTDAERGKRYCASGSVVEIKTEKGDGWKLDEGLLMDDSVRLFHFVSVGSSGSLVAQSPARFCGMVSGRFDYSNSGGGTGHAVELVGMFDLPENKK